MKKAVNYKIIAKTLSNLEPLLADELKAIGARNINLSNRAVEFEGGKELLYSANINCRTATRILKVLDRFYVKDADSLYKSVSRINWLDLLTVDHTFSIDVSGSHPAFRNSMYAAQKVKDAIVDQIRAKKGRRPSVNSKNPDLRINLHLNHKMTNLSLDSSGQPLHMRGYRKNTGVAPLSEVLAAGLVLLSKWNGSRPLIDGMCGSGTIPIEAALIAKNIVPGLIRKNYGFMRWVDYDKHLYTRIVSKAKKSVNSKSITVFASDIDRKLIKEAKYNADRAGLKDSINFETNKFQEIKPPVDGGTVIINPPYGERLDDEDIELLYKEIGDSLKQNFNGYDAFILTGNLKASKKIGLKPSKKITLYNGPIECRLLHYQIYKGSRKLKKSEMKTKEI